MNFSIAVFALLMSAGGNMTDFDINPSTEEVVIPIIEESTPITNEMTSEDQKKFKPGKNMIGIDPLRGNFTVKVGQQIYYSAGVHGSVGYTADASSSDSEALPFVESFIEYDDKRNARMSGGDSATKYFIFDVVKAGTYEVLVQHYFRGDLENEYTITINVEEV